MGLRLRYYHVAGARTGTFLPGFTTTTVTAHMVASIMLRLSAVSVGPTRNNLLTHDN